MIGRLPQLRHPRPTTQFQQQSCVVSRCTLFIPTLMQWLPRNRQKRLNLSWLSLVSNAEKTIVQNRVRFLQQMYAGPGGHCLPKG